jgi:hypothetical protein
VPTYLLALDRLTRGTVLAPSNEAWSKYSGDDGHSVNDTAFLESLLSYHIVKGVYPSVVLKEDVKFLPTLLGPGQFANVTGGLHLGAYPAEGNVVFETGLKERSGLVTAVRRICPGRLYMHRLIPVR